MANVAESTARVARGITAGRRRPGDFAAEIDVATRRRHGDVQSFLESLKTSRGQATRERAAESRAAARTRHGEVLSMLGHMEASRCKATRAYRTEAGAIMSSRQNEVTALLKRFGREQAARERHRRELAAVQRDEAAAFMRNLTQGVAALLDNLDSEGRDRSAEIRERLAAYARDRRQGIVIWGGAFRRGRSKTGASPDAIVQKADLSASTATGLEHGPSALEITSAGPRVAPKSADHPPVFERGPVQAAKAAATPEKSTKSAGPPSQRSAGSPGHRSGPHGRHGGHSK
jgi:hypothetical protein